MDLSSADLWRLAWGLLWRQALLLGLVVLAFVVLRATAFEPPPTGAPESASPVGAAVPAADAPEAVR